MNSSEQPVSPVVVTIAGCTREDADTVFHLLGESYASDRAADDVPQYVSEGRTTVWTATFDVTAARPAPGPKRLGSPVEAEVQGGYWAVDRMRETLAAAFVVHDEGMAAGDQEKDVQLRLESRL
ncbi:hypothetical protein GCM10010387_24990 [Streptomyces inusitatus]|uniref:Uncharacterized protein n=1 Tax=Streptomyces inusitatus TaxID=68221 RepID=A0A918US54_9ACTN|nr:hypothetical protein [Streptomyces inusitatus]GGZ30417.1 hypothetical protein GCM10010387_24990 [Streptomyces inusitatus]